MSRSTGRWFIFFYSLAMLTILLILAIWYYRNGLGGLLPTNIPPVVYAAAWSGALGGTITSLKGVFDHKLSYGTEDHVKNTPWDNGLLPWHLGRPFTGVAVGIFVFIAFNAISSGNPSPATIAAASFVLGMKEKDFFNYVKQVGSVILGAQKQNSRNDQGQNTKMPADKS